MAKTIVLNNGVEIPTLGFGTWGLRKGVETHCILTALSLGYRHIDTAKIYGTEPNVGEGIKLSGIPRRDVFVTTKLWNADQGYDSALKAIDESLEKLGTDYVDLYLIHWPYTDEMQGENRRRETWKAMEEIYRSGKARAIGVSNYLKEHIEEMKIYATVWPTVNQIECHPLWTREYLVKYCHENGIAVTQYSPLTRKEALDHPVILEIADKYEKTPAQILLRWGLQRGNIVIPKSSDDMHINENRKIYDFELEDEDMQRIFSLDQQRSVMP